MAQPSKHTTPDLEVPNSNPRWGISSNAMPCCKRCCWYWCCQGILRILLISNRGVNCKSRGRAGDTSRFIGVTFSEETTCFVRNLRPRMTRALCRRMRMSWTVALDDEGQSLGRFRPWLQVVGPRPPPLHTTPPPHSAFARYSLAGGQATIYYTPHPPRSRPS